MWEVLILKLNKFIMRCQFKTYFQPAFVFVTKTSFSYFLYSHFPLNRYMHPNQGVRFYERRSHRPPFQQFPQVFAQEKDRLHIQMFRNRFVKQHPGISLKSLLGAFIPKLKHEGNARERFKYQNKVCRRHPAGHLGAANGFCCFL